MKTKILILFSVLLQISCSNNGTSTKPDPVFQLPPETQIGANTFGVTINGKVYIPRDPKGTGYAPSLHGLTLWGSPPDGTIWKEVEIKDGASAVGFLMIIRIQPLTSIGKIILQTSNFHNQSDSIPFSHIYFRIWNSKINNYSYYGSVENLGEINITRNDTINFIFSGNFSGKFVCYDNPDDVIEITDGRFDIGPGIHDKIFP